ncbi:MULTISPECIES: hypothetical protein [unclassified Nonomuraea]|uniref:hypothetical protein n=1 Tax=unclassified Nonomuraea TaxID=2593643 RepID=UPI0033E3D89A
MTERDVTGPDHVKGTCDMKGRCGSTGARDPRGPVLAGQDGDASPRSSGHHDAPAPPAPIPRRQRDPFQAALSPTARRAVAGGLLLATVAALAAALAIWNGRAADGAPCATARAVPAQAAPAQAAPAQAAPAQVAVSPVAHPAVSPVANAAIPGVVV